MSCGNQVFRTLISAAVLAAVSSPGLLLANPRLNLTPYPFPAAGAPYLAQMLDSARMWEAKNRIDLARSVLQKVLLVDSTQAEALGQLGLLEIRAQRLPEAKRILDQLRKRSPDHFATKALADAYRIETTDKKEMATVRLLARSGREEEAANRLKALFPKGAPLSGELASDYYRILAGTPPGRVRAIAELNRIVNSQPENLRVRLLLASMLTEREETRQSGLKMTATLAQRPDADRKSALELWRRTLTRVDDDPVYIPWFERYLQESPNDSGMQEQITILQDKLALQRQLDSTVEHQLIRREVKQLQHGDLAEAKSISKKNNSKDMQLIEDIGDLGLLRLRDGHHDEAQELFEQALRLDPGNASKWTSLRETAMFWGRVGKVRASLAQGKAGEAEVDAQALLAIKPENATLHSLLADVLLAQGKKQAAETVLRRLIDGLDPDIDALEKLVKILRDDGRVAEAGQIFSRVEEQVNTTFSGTTKQLRLHEARATMLSILADDFISKGKNSQALTALEESIQLRSDDAWTRYTLASLYRRIGIPVLARSVMEEGLKASQLPDMRYATALFLNSSDDIDAAMAMLEQIPEADRSEGVRSLQHNLSAQRLIRSSRLQFKQGHYAEAGGALREATTLVVDEPNVLATIAKEWITQGQADTGLQLVKNWLDRHPKAPEIPLRLRYGELLASAERDDDLVTWLAGLQAMSGLDAAQRLDVDDQLFRRTLRKSSRLIDDGKLDAAEASLMSVTQERYNDRRWLLVVADLRTARRDYAGAAEATRQVLVNVHEDDVDTRLDMARRFISARRIQEANVITDALSVKFPDRADIIVQRGSQAQAWGDYDEAAVLYQHAMALEANDPLMDDSNESRAERAFRWLSDRRQGQVATAYMQLSKPGDNGISRLESTEIPFYVRIPVGYDGHAFFHVDTVKLDAGNLSVNDLGEIADHGKVEAAVKGVLSLGSGYAGRLAQQAQGVALAAGYEADNWRFDIGTTPLGFPVQDVVGGIRYRNSDGPSAFSIDFSRRPVASSVVSYAGAKDLVTGEVWGGARRNGLNLHYAHDVASGSVFADLGAGFIDGRNLQTNHELTLRTGVELPLLERPDDKVTLGAIINYWQYSQNQRYYTFGQGGYYSPQSYRSLSLPLDWMGRSGLLSYRFRGSVGYSKSREDSAEYYPTRSQLQADSGNPVYAGGSGGGISYSIAAAMEYRLTPNWVAGVDMEMDRSTYYAPDRTMFYLRHFFEPQTGSVPLSPRPVRPYRSY